MSTIRRYQEGKGFIVTVVACGVIAFAVSYYAFRGDEDTSNSAQQGATTEASAPTSDQHESSSPVQAARSIDAPLSELEPRPVLRPTGLTDQSKSSAQAAAVYLPSITFKALPQQQHGASREGHAGGDEVASNVSPEELKLKSESLEIYADSGGCTECMNSKGGGLAIPPGCVYAAYTITQVHREPDTWYLDRIESDKNERVSGVRISVGINKIASSNIAPSITMRLTVASACPS